MKPLKNLELASLWLLRIGIVFLFIAMYGKSIDKWAFDNYRWIINMVYLLSSITLFIGGFLRKSTVTIIAGLLIAAISIYQIVPIVADGKISFFDPTLFQYIVMTGVGMLFASIGNR
ncbi:MAG: hypothetical protein U0L34_01725 [Paludibacteraceae bacterium]|jgi:hypothetical protein|nr:hypothetical protein [Paludibacteraceae bacterium]